MRELALLLNAKIPLVSALTILIDSTIKPIIKKRLCLIKKDVSGGLSLSQSLAKYPREYSPLTCHLIHAGERASALPEVLENIAVYQEKIAQLKASLIKALIYPVVVLITACLITLGLLFFIIPQFERLFESFGASLPLLTRAVIVFSEILKNNFFIFSGLILILGFIVVKKFLLIPPVKKIHQKFMAAQMTRTLSMLLKAGVPLANALKFVSAPVLHEKIMRGEMLSNALQSQPEFSAMMIQMVRVGEESGMLSEMLLRIAVITEAGIDQTLARFTQWLEPAIMIFMGVVIGGLVMAMYLPVFQLGSVV